ncbi:SDR family NAD(P)-dependent oxidoreductase [Microbacterium gilvum]|uniref:SDR family NAD(P)-dependent oxidoreductase n=1 Tax=Microbacterium gilvum TaxID=1336204 RepID=UPI0031F0C438
MTVAPRTVLITGASSGLGAEFARRFAARGSALVLVARREDRLQSLADDLRRDHGAEVHVLPADLAQEGAARALRERLDAEGLRIDGLVNNAGFGVRGPAAMTDPVRVSEMVRVDVAALVDLTQEFLADILDADGALVNIASTAAYQPCPGLAAYGAAKAFVLSYTEALAYENRGSAARILAVSPGPTATEFFDVVGSSFLSAPRTQSAAQVVDRALRALDSASRPATVVTGWVNAAAATIVRLLPRRFAVALSARALA